MEAKTRIKRFAELYQETIDDFIKKPHIVIGCGAIGGYIIKILGQIGVNFIHLWDDDTIEEVNIGPQGFPPNALGMEKTTVRAEEFSRLSPDSSLSSHTTRFQKHYDHPEEAYWWLCVDDLKTRAFIYKSAMLLCPTKIIDTRMSGLVYQIYAPSMYEDADDSENMYLKNIQWARDNVVQEACTSRSTPHCAMLAASIGINMALTKRPPFSISGDMMTYKQESVWI